jgi:CrcB protein
MIWYIALGSAIGGVTRYLLGGWVQRLFGGSFLLGLLLRYALETPAISPEVRGFLTIGICGGYTTFSTFSYETLSLLEDAQYLRAGWYVGASVIVSLLGVFAGSLLARELLTLRRGV